METTLEARIRETLVQKSSSTQAQRFRRPIATCNPVTIAEDLAQEYAKQVEEKLSGCGKEITVAVMGCAVNGPGEAREADLGIAGGDGEGLIFKKGRILRKVPEESLLNELLKEVEAFS